MRATEGYQTLGWGRRPLLTLFCYLLLVAGSVAFLLPFLWLVTTSVKVDRELYASSRTSLPLTPNARVNSPFIDEEYYKDALTPQSEPYLGAVKAVIHEKEFSFPGTIDRDLAERQMARGLLKKMSGVLPAEEWGKGQDVIRKHARQIASPLVLSELFGNVYRRLLVGKVLVRSYDLEEQELGDERPASQRFENLTPKVATLSDISDNGTSCALVKYDFSKGEDLVLEQTYRVNFDLHNLHRIQVSLRPDDNWQRLTMTVEKLGSRFEAVRVVPMANLDWGVITWQEPGPDDSSNRIKSWILLKKTAEAKQFVSDPHLLKITLRLQKTGLFRAWLGKILLNYQITATYIPFVRYFSTSLYLILLNVILMLFSSSIVAYAVSRLVWPGRDFVFMLMLATMMVPAQVTMIPAFLVWKNLGFYNSLVPLWAGSAFGGAFNIFLLRQFMKGIPRDIEDAARIDGCGILRIYWHIILPLVKPTLAAIALFTAIGAWNDFKGSLLYVADQRLYPMAFGIYAFSVQIANNPAQTMAASILMALPIILLFFFAQKYFIKGVTLTGIKG